MEHELKILEPYADAIIQGRKRFDVRRNDRGFNAGDTVRFRVLDRDWMQPILSHNLNRKLWRITYVHSGFGLQPDFVVFGIEEIRNNG